MVLPITATYRLQLRGPHADEHTHRSFGFAEAAACVPYLADLGVSHLYLSPIMQAPPTSAHNYDVTDPTTINPELGGLEGFRTLAATARRHGLGIIIDIVPNHVGVESPQNNPWWWDVLKYGKASAYEPYFDIDWHADNGASGRLGLPILGSPTATDELRLGELDGEPVLDYHGTYLPIAPGTLVPDDPAATHDRQHYQLMYWRGGVNSYRRFFSVTGLAGLRQERDEVFDATHGVLRQLVAENLIDGVRVDHPDGLADPVGYVKKLRRLIGPNRWLVIEKILGVDEPLDPRLPVDGTTGYDALRELDGVFIAREAEAALSMVALEQSGSTWNDAAIDATEHQLKSEVAREELAVEVQRLARAIRRDNFSTAGTLVSDEELIDTIIELVAQTPVYRADYESLSRVTASVIADMSQRFPSRRRALDLVAAALIAEGEAKIRFAQVCGAVMAKGVEDTTFYRACRLVALQEVGGAPGRFGVSPAEFHLLQKERSRLWPATMTTLSTHDTKRSEDVRARIIEITERPDDFAELVRKVAAIVPAPDAATGHFLLQNLVGLWPRGAEVLPEPHVERFSDYAIKAVREAGVHTTWMDPDEGFENSLRHWIDALVAGPATSLISDFVDHIAPGAEAISVGRKLLHLIGPGIPDIYQGTEFFDDSLVDPDNRRFVDFTARKQALERTEQPDTPDRIKLAVVQEALRVRQQRPELFAHGDYHAVFAEGPGESHVVGIGRGTPVEVIALAVRRPLDARWEDTTITLPRAAGTWVEKLTGRRFSGQGAVVPADVMFATYPAALLVAEL